MTLTLMKTIFYLLIIICFSNCNNSKETISNFEKGTNSKRKTSVTKITETRSLSKDTLVKKIRPFKINNIECYWEFTLIINKGEKFGNSILNLKNIGSNKNLLSNSDACRLGFYNGVSEDNLYLNEKFKDANFDGFQDFVIHSVEESGTGCDFYNVYLFDKSTKEFKFSKELSGCGFEINIKEKTVSYYWKMGIPLNEIEILHFDKKGKIKFKEITTREVIDEENRLLKTTYKKIIDGRIIKSDIKTTEFEGY
jgi:hypothetical protein